MRTWGPVPCLKRLLPDNRYLVQSLDMLQGTGHCPHTTDEDTEAQRHSLTCLTTCSGGLAEREMELWTPACHPGWVSCSLSGSQFPPL